MMTFSKWALLTALLTFVPAFAVHAKTIAIPDENISIDIPDAWNSTPRPGTLFSAGDATNTSVITLAVFPNDENRGIETSYTDKIKNGLLAQGPRLGGATQIVKEGPLTIAGAPAYLIEARIDLPQSQTVYMFQYPIFANRKTYVVALQNFDASKNDQMEAIAKSLRFVTPPELPNAPGNPTPRAVPIPGEDLSITLPPGWTTADMEGNLLFAKDETFISTVSIKSYPYESSPQAFIETFKKITPATGLLAGATIEYSKEGPATLADVPGYFVQGTTSIGKSEKDYTCEYAFAANKKLYVIALQTGDPAKASIVEDIAHSLRFGHVPQIPDPPVSNYERGLKLGQNLFYLILAGLFVLVIGAGRYFLFRRLRKL